MPANTSTILQQAIAAHQLNDLYLAEKLYLSILEIDAHNPDANHNLGLLYFSVDPSFEALPFLRSTSETHPQIEQFWISYFEALSSAGKHGVHERFQKQAKKNNLQPNVVRQLEAIVLRAKTATTYQTPRQKMIHQSCGQSILRSCMKLA